MQILQNCDYTSNCDMTSSTTTNSGLLGKPLHNQQALGRHFGKKLVHNELGKIASKQSL